MLMLYVVTICISKDITSKEWYTIPSQTLQALQCVLVDMRIYHIDVIDGTMTWQLLDDFLKLLFELIYEYNIS